MPSCPISMLHEFEKGVSVRCLSFQLNSQNGECQNRNRATRTKPGIKPFSCCLKFCAFYETNQNVAAMPYEYPNTVEVKRVALRVHEETTEEAMRPVLIDLLAVKYISESWTSEKYFLSANVVRVIRSAKAPPRTNVNFYLVITSFSECSIPRPTIIP